VKIIFSVAILAAGLLIIGGTAFAHHGVAGYDNSKTVTLDGTVTKYNWINPHVFVYVDAKDEKGKVENWIIELAAPLMMQRFGWTKDSIKVGDHLVADVHPAKSGAAVGISGTSSTLLKLTVNGKDLPHL